MGLRIPIIAARALIDGEATIAAFVLSAALAGRADAGSRDAAIVVGRGVAIIAGEALADILNGAASGGIVAAHRLALRLDDEVVAGVGGAAAHAIVLAGRVRGALEAVVASVTNVYRFASIAARAGELTGALGLLVLLATVALIVLPVLA